MLDPALSAEAASSVIADLQAQLVSKEIELYTLGSMLQSDAAQMVATRKSIAGIRQQIEIEKKKLVSPNVVALNRVAASYLDYKAMVDFQTDVYKVSLAAFEKMRLDSLRKVKSLAIISNPQLAEEVEYPKRVYMLAAWLFGLSLLFGLTKLTIEIIEDHRD
jgi:capsular polysaccharide transport system permease protein